MQLNQIFYDSFCVCIQNNGAWLSHTITQSGLSQSKYYIFVKIKRVIDVYTILRKQF